MEEPEQPSSNGAMSASEVLHLVSLFDKSLERMESRLVLKMDENSSTATERWKKHDVEAEKTLQAWQARFEKIEGSMLTVERSLKAHLDREHDEQVATDARVKPVKTLFGWLWSHWRDLVLLGIGIMALLTFSLDWLTHVLNGG